MTDQPRDLAAKVEAIERIRQRRASAFDPQKWSFSPSWMDVDTLLMHIAALSRELEEQRKALRWALQRGAFHPGHGHIYVPKSDSSMMQVDPPAHLAPILAEAMRGKP